MVMSSRMRSGGSLLDGLKRLRVRWSRRAPRTPAAPACSTGAEGCRSCRRRPARWPSGPTSLLHRDRSRERLSTGHRASRCRRADTSASYWKSRASARISADSVLRVLPHLIRERLEPLGAALDRRLPQLIDQRPAAGCSTAPTASIARRRRRSMCTGGWRGRSIDVANAQPLADGREQLSLRYGFRTNASTPASRASSSVSARPLAVTETIAAFDPRSRSRRTASSPPMPGMRTSMSTRSGCHSSWTAMASSPLAAVRVEKPMRDSSSSSRSRLVVHVVHDQHLPGGLIRVEPASESAARRAPGRHRSARRRLRTRT